MWKILLLAASMVAAVAQGFAQPFPVPPLVQIGVDPVWGPICNGPQGPAKCDDVQRWISIQQILPTIPLQFIGVDQRGQICAGPLGPGPCNDVRLYIAMQRVAGNQFQLRQVSVDPVAGPICMGPLGLGTCDAVRLYLMQTQVGSGPFQQVDPRNVQLTNRGGADTGALCGGPSGSLPCTLIAQNSLDRFGGSVPAPNTFGLPQGLASPQSLAAECAQRVQLDVAAFAGCVGQQIILPQKEQAVLECAVSSRDTPSFASCAAPKLGIDLSQDQRKIAECAMRSNGMAGAFTACAGTALAQSLGPSQQAILSCATNAQGDAERFATCSASRFLSRDQSAVVNCAVSTNDATSFATCAAAHAGIRMSDDQRILARCALSSSGDMSDFAGCAGQAFLGRNLGPNEQAVLNCAANSGGDAASFATCSAGRLLGGRMSKEQEVALKCAAQSGADATSWAACAGANMINLQLNPEQQIAVQCVVSTGGQPYAAAGCMASRLTARELTKCLSDGIGGRGCFGDNNDLVGRNGWVRRSLGQLAGGPNSVINNPGQIWGGDNSFVRNPGQIWGGNNSFVRNPSQIWGGPNSVFNNPGQLLPSPKPLQIGTVGGKRICLPWC